MNFELKNIEFTERLVMKKSLLFLSTCCMVIPAMVSAQSSETSKNPQKENRPPNIIFILADDLGYGDLSCYGQKKYNTPHIDALAKSGIRFTNFYSTSPVCAPARCAILTGKHSGQGTIRDNGEMPGEGQSPMLKDDYTIAEMFKKNGYNTACVGKWGLGFVGSEGDPNHQGFDLFFGPNCQRQAHFYYPKHVWRNSTKIPFPQNVPNKGGPDYLGDHLEKEATQFITDNKDTPFFLWYTTPVPHASLQVKDEDIKPFVGRYPEKPFPGGGYAAQPTPNAAAAAMVTRLDNEVGRMHALVKKLGIEDNTIFIFSSDNGPSAEGGKDMNFFNSRGNLTGQKCLLNEGGVRVPMIICAPKMFEGNRVVNEPFAFDDLFPTFTDVIQTVAPKDITGISFYPTLKNQNSEQKKKDYMYWEFGGYGGQVVVRKGNMKAYAKDLRKKGVAEFALYDLSKDPNEKTNIADKNPRIIEEFKAQIPKLRSTPHYKNFDMKALQDLSELTPTQIQ